MDLYDDIDTNPRSNTMDGWSSGIKMLQTQLAIKKAQIQAPREPVKKNLSTPITSHINAKKNINEELTNLIFQKNDDSPPPPAPPFSSKTIIKAQPLVPVIENIKKDEWEFVDEYDPLRPNDYEKLKDRHHGSNKKERDGGRSSKRHRGRNSYSHSSHHEMSSSHKSSGFSQIRHSDEDRYSPPTAGGGARAGGGSGNKGVAIAPPRSLQEFSITNESGDGSSNVTIPYSASKVAAKIMAKYGFKDGQGLGRQEQGMSMALQVEKTSKRGGRIIHEKDVFLPPPPPVASISPPPAFAAGTSKTTTKTSSPEPSTSTNEPSITEIMKAPSKVVLLRNMVGPGDVDEDLEPEVKDECNTKYGDVVSVVIHEAFGTAPEDAVKIFVEFKRIESAIKAVVDLNGRFFGGRQVRAGFYNYDKFKSFQLN